MKNLNLKLTSAVLAVAAIVLNAQFANAADSAFGHKISKVTKYDDGIVMSEFADQTGFMVEGGSATFLYNTQAQTITCVTDNNVTEVFVGNDSPTTAQADDAFAQVAINN